MTEFIVSRHGWNEVNQVRSHGLPEKMALARIQADSPDEACWLALEQVSLVAGQHLSAEPAEVVDARLNNVNLRIEALESQENP